MNFRFSGHETFPCRYTWLPKVVRHLGEGGLFQDEDDAMVRLGVGKNMVRAIKFWADAAEILEPSDSQPGRLGLTPFGRSVFHAGGHDEFLEDIRTLWLIHWQFSSNAEEPLFAWHFMLNSWHLSDFTRTEVLEAFQREADRLGRKLSPVTLETHFTTFLHTYIPTKSRKGEVMEDNLDCPLVELELLRKVGERSSGAAGRRESIYAFRMEDKPEISPELFVYCLHDYWQKHHRSEQTLAFRHVAVAPCSPGQVFKLPEHAIRERLESISADSAGMFDYDESASVQQVVRRRHVPQEELLSRIYAPAFQLLPE